MQLGINVSRYQSVFKAQLHSHLIALQTILDATDGDSYALVKEVTVGTGCTITLSKLDREEFKQQELDKAFIVIFRALRVYMDRLLVVIGVVQELQESKRKFTSQAELDVYVALKESEFMHRDLDDQQNFSDMLDTFFAPGEPTKDVLLELLELMNRIFFHQNLVLQDSTFQTLAPVAYVNGRRITHESTKLQKDDNVGYDCEIRERPIKAGTAINISKTEIFELAGAFDLVVAPYLDNKTKELVQAVRI